MNQPEHFEILKGYAVYRPIGEISLQQGVQWVASAITFAREQKIRRLLLITNGVTGFPPPSLAERYFFVQEWARASQGQVCVSIVARPEMIDHEKFAIIVAQNAGLRSDVFESEKEALAWLRSIDQAAPAARS